MQLSTSKLKDLSATEAHLVLDGPGESWQRDTLKRSINWINLRAQMEAARLRQSADNAFYRDKTVKVLKEVVVRVRKNEERPDDIRRRSLHGTPDATVIFDANSGSFANLYEMIRGRLAGVEIRQRDAGYQVLVRGPGSVQGGSGPLFLMDGMALQSDDLLNYTPTDIERVELLKNAGTAGYYGARGGGGVIAFYTKTYRPGQPKNEEKKG